MKQYLNALQHIMDNGEEVSDRTGIGTYSVFGYQMQFNLQSGFPAVTTKKLAWRSVIGELLWFLEGSTDERRLAELTFSKNRSDLIGTKTIWTANADAQGVELGYTNDDLVKQLGPVYGHQWRHFDRADGENENKTDQIAWLINEILINPHSRRLILSAWNPNQINEMALPPCHTLAQFRVMNGKLSCQLYQRSADMFLGVPFNIASYSLLTHIIAKEVDLDVGEFIHTFGDLHIYEDHLDVVKQQIERKPGTLPTLSITSNKKINEYEVKDFVLENYQSMDSLKATMAV